ncbi:hypothetical protein V5799_010989 [Amblyomma americanum]|uniref:GH18 domain-containing protein n=1 Tax=Amblyomma americanum TaxID=6943 RepID=A0AAQ4EI50_AMBAM
MARYGNEPCNTYDCYDDRCPPWYFSVKRTYVLQRLPTAYCSEFIYYALYVTSTGSLEGKRHALDTDALTQMAALNLGRRHRGQKIRMHVTIGGSRRDSPSFVRMLQRHEVRDGVVKHLVASRGDLYDGVNIHWDRPGDSCDQAFTPTFFRALIEELYRNKIAVLLTVPPVLELVRKFWLVNVMRYLDHVIVTTHMLRRKLALFAGPAELALRMRRSYASRMGDTPVAVFDLFLGDFDGHCSLEKQAKESPLLAAIAETGLTP